MMYENPFIGQENVFSKKLNDLIVQSEKELFELKDIHRAELIRNEFNTFIKNLLNVLEKDAREMLENINQEDFNIAVGGLYRYFGGRKSRSVYELPSITKDNIQNILLFRQVHGYSSPDLKAREKNNPIPSAQEVLMGCYVEQLEEQVRNAVLILRSKGYKTFESGFHDHFNGTQFFGMRNSEEISVPETTVVDIKEKFNIDVKLVVKKDRTVIDFIPTKYYSIKEWKNVLDFFANSMPSLGEVAFTQIGSAIDFAAKVREEYPIEQILISAKTEKEIVLVKKLYECKTKGDVYDLIKVAK